MISAQATVVRYNCDGSSTRFDFPYKILEPSQLRVVRALPDRTFSDLRLNTDYSLTGVGHAGGVTVTTVQAYADGQIVLWLGVPAVQSADYVENDPFAAESHEQALDRLTLMIGQTRGDLRQAVRFPISEASPELPPVVERAGKLWASASDGALIFVPPIRGEDMLSLNGASLYFDNNASAQPRLVIDALGAGSPVRDGVPNPGGAANAVVMLQDDAPLLDSGQARLWFSSVFRGWDPDHPEDAQAQVTAKHSRFTATIQARSEISAIPVGLPTAPTDYLPQEVGCLALVATAGANTERAKVEALVVSAREEEGMAGPSKGVAVQAITVRNTQGPDPDDRSQITDNDDGQVETGADVQGVGSFTIRCNGGTVNQRDPSTGAAEPTYGGYRSWGALVAGGRAGYLNGVVLGKRHHFQGDMDPARDYENVGGWGGVWGGRSFWHDATFAAYAKEACPGWLTVGHDGVPLETDGTDGIARAPLDLEVDLANPPAAWSPTGDGAGVLSFNGERLLAPRQGAIADCTSGQETAKINAILGVLRAHGLIGA